MKKEELLKNILGLKYYDLEQFEKDVNSYVAAIRQRRMLCRIHSVSASGMSRTISFHSCEIGKDGNGWYRQYWSFFKAMGFTALRDKDYFRINGCGMDMVFDTNYRIIHNLGRLGYLDKKDVDDLAQMTPVVL
jgi:hypothetical protein